MQRELEPKRTSLQGLEGQSPLDEKQELTLHLSPASGMRWQQQSGSLEG